MAKVLTFAQQKGGSGKSTLASQLAIALSAGRAIALVDLDPQRSLAGWVDARAARRGGDLDFEFFESSELRAGTDIRRARKAADLVFVDCPGAADVLLRSVLRETDLAICPAQPSAPDIWALRATLKMALREAVEARVVLNRLPPRGGLPETLAAELDAAGADMAAAGIGNRIAIARAFAAGAGVTETERSGKAAQEVTALAEEIAATLASL